MCVFDLSGELQKNNFRKFKIFLNILFATYKLDYMLETILSHIGYVVAKRNTPVINCSISSICYFTIMLIKKIYDIYPYSVSGIKKPGSIDPGSIHILYYL